MNENNKLTEVFEKYGKSVVGVKPVSPEKLSKYCSLKVEPIEGEENAGKEYFDTYDDLFDGKDVDWEEVIEQAEIQIKYRGYVEREKYFADKMHRLESIAIPEGFDYEAMQSLTIEARQKLSRIRPETIGQASRIPGVSPADINVLLVKFGR